LLLLLSGVLQAQTIENRIDSVISKLEIIESNGDSTQVGDDGYSWGILQIRPIYVQEVNESYASTFKHIDAMSVAKSRGIAHLYLLKGCELYKIKNGIYPPDRIIARMHNAGMYNWQNPKADSYEAKFLKL